MKQKTLAVALSLLIVIAMLAGCTSGQPTPTAAPGLSTTAPAAGTQAPQQTSGADQGDATGDSLYNAPGELPIVFEKIDLSVFAPASTDIPRAESDMTKWMEEITNIHINWETAAGDAYREKMQLTLASGIYPDMIVPGVSYRIDKVTEQQLGIQGIIVPLNEYFDNVSVGYANAFAEMPGMRDYMTALDGNIYSLPNVDGALHIQYQNKMWLNMKWMENLNLEVPTTVDEFYDVLKAFKDNDANGNGDPNDEIPFSAAGSSALDVFLMNPFILTPATSRMWVNDGAIVFSVMEPGYREGVKYLARLYADGLMNPELFTWNATTQINANENGEEPILGAVLGMRPGNFTSLSGFPDHSRKWEQYYPIAPLAGVNGNETITNYNAYASTFQTGVAMITSSCEYPEAAFRMVDLLATPEMSIITTNGPENQGWRYAEAGEIGLDGNPAKVRILTGDRPENWGGWDQLMGRVQTPAYLASLYYDQDPYGDGVDPMQGRQVILYQASLPHQAVSQSLASVLPDLYYEDSVIDELSLLQTTITDYVNEMLVAFVTGARNVDSDWDGYMSQLKTLGAERYIQIVQETYDASAFAK
ncbi:MAG: extracellular solute-binding protein [Christensenellales bacterium]|jgi:putative aldouronate transport system substrate-binding protein